MRAVVQRVRSASVTVDGRTVGMIGAGLLAFVGVAADDGPGDVKYWRPRSGTCGCSRMSRAE